MQTKNALTEFEPAAANPNRAATSGQRLMSVDALRGFDMFWIIGADSLVYALNRMSRSRPTAFLADQLEHAEWQGFHFYDLIFPLFVFIMGVSLVFSLTKSIERAGRTEALKRVFRRGVLLFLVALFYSGGFTNPWPDMRLMGVLNRIALAYMAGGLLFCFFKPRALAGICAVILAGYWGLMSFAPIRDIQLTRGNIAALAEKRGDTTTAAYFRNSDSPNPSAVKGSVEWAAVETMFYDTTQRVTGRFDKGLNLSDHIDFQYLLGRKYDTFFDPEGCLSTIPAVATCLLGMLAGFLLKDQRVPEQRKVMILVGGGVVAAALGWIWGAQFPVIKKIWTSSYVLVAGGYSAILLGVFYQVVDIWEARSWCQPFVWMGMNSITIYLTSNIIGGFRKLAGRLAGGDVRTFFDTHLARGAGDMLISVVGLLLAFWFVYFLYRRKIFLRL
jgi:predicted acyltransferase